MRVEKNEHPTNTQREGMINTFMEDVEAMEDLVSNINQENLSLQEGLIEMIREKRELAKESVLECVDAIFDEVQCIVVEGSKYSVFQRMTEDLEEARLALDLDKNFDNMKSAFERAKEISELMFSDAFSRLVDGSNLEQLLTPYVDFFQAAAERMKGYYQTGADFKKQLSANTVDCHQIFLDGLRLRTKNCPERVDQSSPIKCLEGKLVRLHTRFTEKFGEKSNYLKESKLWDGFKDDFKINQEVEEFLKNFNGNDTHEKFRFVRFMSYMPINRIIIFKANLIDEGNNYNLFQ